MGTIRDMINVSGIMVLIANNLVEKEVLQFSDNGSVLAGAGYSRDMQQIVPQKCFNATVSPPSEQQGVIELGTAQSFEEFGKVLGMSASGSAKYWKFSADAKANYMRSIKENDYSFSLNYYQYATNNVALQLAGYGEKSLTETGRSYYNGGKNPYFGVFCGDYYIKSYQQGAFLTMGLSIQFRCSKEKEKFKGKAGFSFGDIVSATVKVNNISKLYKIKGKVRMHAFQMGGDPSKLAHVLANDSSGDYYATSCSLTTMKKCIHAASGLLYYAKFKFSDQFSTTNSTGLTPLGVSFTKFIPIHYIGLTASDSLVTPEVEQYRDELFNKLKENQYYQQKLYPFFNKGYPVELDDDFLKKASRVLSKANRNVDILIEAHGGAADCYNFPDKCKNVKDSIYRQLQNITEDDLQFLEAVKYFITTRGGKVYNSGMGGVWHAAPDNNPGKENLVNMKKMYVTDNFFKYRSVVHIPHSPHNEEFFFDGRPTNGSMIYIGELYFNLDDRHEESKLWPNYTERKVLSPFYFDAYNITK